MDYEALTKADFDAVVTGELTHYAIWLEAELNEIITDYFVGNTERKSEFRRFLLYRDGLTFQDKIEIVRGMVPVLGTVTQQKVLKDILKEIEDFKSWRNALAHGLDDSPDNESPNIRVEVVTRSGKEKVIEITPQSHKLMMEQTEKLVARVQKARTRLNA